MIYYGSSLTYGRLYRDLRKASHPPEPTELVSCYTNDELAEILHWALIDMRVMEGDIEELKEVLKAEGIDPTSYGVDLIVDNDNG